MGNKRVLVTGVAGFIGSHVAAHCINLGFHVTGVDDLSGGFRENIPEGVDFREGSVVDSEWVAGLWRGGNYEYIYHLAAYAAEGLTHFIRRHNYSNNLLGTINLVNQAVLHKAQCFVFTSSIAVYGRNQTPMTEDLTPQPEDPYGIAKYAAELDLAAAHRIFGFPYIIFRPHNVYGERQNIADRYRNVIGIFMNAALTGKPMTIFGDGLQTRAFSYIDDVAPIIARAPLVPEAYQKVFNIGADRLCTVGLLAEKVAAALGVLPNVVYLAARDEVLHAFAAHDRLKQVFLPPEPVSLEKGLACMADWIVQRGPRPPVRFDKIEVRCRLPRSWED